MKRLLACLVGFAAACTATATPPELDPGLAELALTEVHPGIVLPKSAIDLVGSSFVDEDAGLAYFHCFGTMTSSLGEVHEVNVELPAKFVDSRRLRVSSADSLFAALGDTAGVFEGSADVAVDSAIDHTRHRTAALSLTLQLASTLTPRIDSVSSGTKHVNQDVLVTGDGFLLDNGEGQTRAVLDGCFLPQDATGDCAKVGTKVSAVEITGRPATAWSRTQLVFPFSPAIAGIHPGTFSGTVRLKNVFAAGDPVASASHGMTAQLERPVVTTFDPPRASLGQWVNVTGAGFVGGAAGSVTAIRLVGTFVNSADAASRSVDLILLPRFLTGDRLRYVLDEVDQLGQALDLRSAAGTFTGSVQPIIFAGGDQEMGTTTPVTLGVDHVKQVIYVNFTPSYVESLRLFGLLAADSLIRDRVFAVAVRDYAGINVEWRRDPVTDFATYSQVDILGPDPNDLDLLGYDNTPGKDVDNSRLYDRIGGVNATTQEDGFPGYGGVFAENFLGFSQHPPSSVNPLPIDSDLFDDIFDPLRADMHGRPAGSEDIDNAPVLSDGFDCPAKDRATQVACAIFVLGNLIGTTMTHEVGHSLGLAYPYGDAFHNFGDLPNRLMESGSDRPFEERAEIFDFGPGRFCDTEYEYLRTILPGAKSVDPYTDRPPCE